MQDHKKTVEKLEKLLSTTNKDSKVLYVPGGNDSRELFEKDKAMDAEAKSVNVHKDTYELAKDLLLVGLGGAVPAHF